MPEPPHVAALRGTCIQISKLLYIVQAGNALASFLPDHLGKDSFEANYTQAFIPGLVTGLRGIRYEPCLLRSAVLGAGASANGLVFNPELFATRSTGAGSLSLTQPTYPWTLHATS